MKKNNIKSQIKQLAKEFDLDYDPKWFEVLWISKRDEIILQYIGNCLDPVYKKYGEGIERIKNIEKFFKNDLKNLSKRYGGEVYSKEHLSSQIKFLPLIKNAKIRKEISNLLEKISKNIKDNKLVLLTKTNIKNETIFIERIILRHELIHILLFQNNLNFGRINNKLWMYDEGLCSYLEAYLDDTINLLEARFKTIKYPYEKQYYESSLIYKKLLKNKKSPKERRKVLMNLLISKTRKRNKNE